MRTMVTLDDDIVAALHTVMRDRDTSFRNALNTAARAGLAGGDRPARPYQQQTFHAKVQPGVDLTRALQLAGDIEDEEIPRKIEFGT